MVALTESIGGTTGVTRLKFTVSLTNDAEPIDMTPAYSAGSSGAAPTSTGSSGPTVVSYTDPNQHVSDTRWTLAWLGNSDSDDLLEGDETAEITVWLHERDSGDAFSVGTTTDPFLDTRLTANVQFSLEVNPSVGSAFELQRTIPAQLDTALLLD